MPELAQRVLPSNIPDLEVHVGQCDGGDILADSRYGFEFWGGVGGEEEGFHLFVKGGFTSVVEAKEEDGVFCNVN